MPRIEEAKSRVAKVYGYFNNHFHGYAVENCIEVLEMLNAARHEQKRVKEKIIRHNMQERPMMYERKLEDFGFNIEELGVEDLLNKLTDKGRLERGKEIRDAEVVFEESSQESKMVKVGRYTIELHLGEKVLRHDCDDWKKGLGIKRICKHVAKLFMTIPEEESGEVLRDMIENKDSWKFQL